MPGPEQNPRRIRFGEFELDLRCGELKKHGRRIKLQEQPLQLLAMLLLRAGDAVTREELRERLWPANTFVDFEHSVNTAVKKLRQALGDDAAHPKFVETLPRRGYRFLGSVELAGSQDDRAGGQIDLREFLEAYEQAATRPVTARSPSSRATHKKF